MKEILGVRLTDIERICILNKLNLYCLRAMVKDNARLYFDKKLTRYQLIYELVFLMDAPSE